MIAKVFMLLGALIFLLAAIGLLKFPDFLTRMAAASKATTLSIALLALGTCLHFQSLEVTLKLAAMILFIFLSTPISAHLLGRIAFRKNEKLKLGNSSLFGMRSDKSKS